MRQRGLAFALCGVSLLVSVAASEHALAARGAQSPYDTLYVVTKDTAIRSAPEVGSAIKAPLAKGTEGVVMRWCRPEFNFRSWAYGSTRERRSMLKRHACEIKVNGIIGFVDGAVLDPM
ncbi:hypothetical protein SAMN04515647_4259 [Cohaesibacter sp. ES.047]|uniref:hypothetical protein n=1 Tax=Cohaesibacter sp. ES.047 TaxID=1798205 RepID=UPI000BB79EC8|nr:hypothetical protein [Cohaesibacter sp. ES.047]SNY93940.1 hypothetical protein SAMN04515647_4259 [Cohaesibacter sp. ES.047]